MPDSFIWQGRTDTEEQTDSRRFYQQVSQHRTQPEQHCDFSLVGFCCDLGVVANLGRQGARTAPDAIRTQLANIAWHHGEQYIQDFGNVLAKTSAQPNAQALLEAQTQMSQRIIQALSLSKKRVLVLGGGHETAFTSLSALYDYYFANQPNHQERLGIINFDAHFDLRKPSARGISSGTPFYQAKQLFKDNFHYCCLGISRESNTQALFERANEYNVDYLLDTQINAQPIEKTQEYIEQFCADKTLLYISIDLDVLPHYQAPAVSAPAVRGVNLNIIESLIRGIQTYALEQNIRIPLCEVSELNPSFDTQNITAKTAAFIANHLLVGDSQTTLLSK